MGLLQGGAFNIPETPPVFAAVRMKTLSARCTRRSPTCTFPTRPRVTRSITHPAQRHTMLPTTRSSPGAKVRRWQVAATQPNMARTGTSGGYSVDVPVKIRGGSGCSRRCCLPAYRRAKKHEAVFMSWSGRMMCARISSGDGGLPSAPRERDASLPVK
jgi:hypothetical protein